MQSGLLVFTDFLGIVAFALAGILAAENKRVDPVGVFIMAFTTAFGGGIMRDLIIGNRPMYWIAHQEYVWATLIMTMFAPCIIKYFQEKVLRQLFVWSDAIGLGFFAAGGTSLSITFGLPYLPSVLLGVCTGVFGGLLRDQVFRVVDEVEVIPGRVLVDDPGKRRRNLGPPGSIHERSQPSEACYIFLIDFECNCSIEVVRVVAILHGEASGWFFLDN